MLSSYLFFSRVSILFLWLGLRLCLVSVRRWKQLASVGTIIFRPIMLEILYTTPEKILSNVIDIISFINENLLMHLNNNVTSLQVEIARAFYDRKELPTIPQESPFQDSYPDFSPYCQTKAIAVILQQKFNYKQISHLLNILD